MPGARVLYWFRTDVRLHDNPALQAALSLNPEVLWPIWCFDPYFVYHGVRVGPNRWQFLCVPAMWRLIDRLDSQRDVNERLTKLNNKSKLFVVRGDPVTVLPALFAEWKVTHLVFEKDTETYALQRDAQVIEACKEAGVECIIRSGHTLWDVEEVMKANNNRPTMNQSALLKAVSHLRPPEEPLPPPSSLPDPGPTTLNAKWQSHLIKSAPDLDSTYRKQKATIYETISGPKGDFSIPTLEELGIPSESASSPHRGGETVALKTLANFLSDRKRTAQFSKPNTSPGDFLPPATTLLSPHLHFGTLSVRKFFYDLRKVVEEFEGQATKPPTSLEGQLLFREMYIIAQFGVPYYERTSGNPYCRYIDWNMSNEYDGQGNVTGHKLEGNSDDDNLVQEWFTRWREGRTGFPWIDAIMRQLKHDGWIHQYISPSNPFDTSLGRHSVACFLTRGQCYISWERGAEVFQEWLIDHDPACNVGNWQWLACTCFFSQFYRVYSPTAFPKKYDPTGALVRHYCPELAKFPDKYVYEPWLASDAEQQKAGCILGKDYPERMLDDRKRREVCLTRMKAAYELGFKGDAKEVMDGTAEKILREKYAAAALPPTPKRKRDEKEKGQKGIEQFVNGKRNKVK